MSYWTTIEGKKIEYSKLENSHLLNILKYIKRIAKEGVVYTINLGYGDHDYQEYDGFILKGKDVLEDMDYKGLVKEAKKRGLETSKSEAK